MRNFLDFIYRNRFLAVFVIFLFLGLALYANSFGNALFWDDDDLITKNAYVQSFNAKEFFAQNEIAGANQISNYWRPLLLISFAIDYKIWGLAPIGFHFTNTVLHIFSAWLAFVFLSLFISSINKKKYFSDERIFLLSFLPSLVFLVHPLNTEAVTYVSGRGDPLSATFSLLALIFYVSFRNYKRRIYILASLLFFIFGLLVKEQVVFLPLLIVLTELFLNDEKGIKRRIMSLLGKVWSFAAVSIVYAVLRLTILDFNNLLDGVDYSLSDSYNVDVWQRLFTFCSVMLLNLKILFVPLGLHMAREISPVASFFSWSVIVFILFLAASLLASIKNWKRSPLVSFGVLWFLTILLPRTNIVAINRPMYEHWLYLPMLGFWLSLFSLVFLLFDKIVEGRFKKIVFLIVGACLMLFVVFLSIATIVRNSDWRDPITFYEKNLGYTPNSYIQRNNLAMAYDESGQYQKAIEQYRQAIDIADIYPQVHYNLANSLVSIGSYEEATKEYEAALKISPRFFEAFKNLVLLLAKSGQNKELEVILKEKEGDFATLKEFWYLKEVLLNLEK